ncbi:MAG: hypothetical protein A2847_02850 [Candidatus Sungbacteria bacterium RIFCSPHIGHO2_01_FULL_50_25]|uniref:DUF5671 domain-containing protein n=1 Tax=Candidatus Sungbacteria bacterium RIFCSPHIGHO2_01_FULL_50_25 TaxID=1802265 RepID=A0A1G2KA11_9BACT|nr:MAG: hypothetical protein A2847_02850 [Candidatus Sungbacteria bacterium RIFCSPHIGHO2_01_FULL_50_25]
MEHAKKVSPKDVFLHLLTTIALYVSAGSFIALLFQYINILYPDVLEYNAYTRESALGIIRWSIASLIVIFPVYIGTSIALNKNYRKEPEKRNLRIRKWLTYFTLFAAAAIIIGDVVTLIYNLLGGGLTTQFMLKIAVVLFAAASVFYYYFWGLKRHNIE